MAFIFFVISLSLFSLFKNSAIFINPTTRQYIDNLGRERFFHGVNVVVKQPPWAPVTDHFDPGNSFSEEDLLNLEDWGLNVIRLGTEWAGFEPVKGQYNYTYLDKIEQIVNRSRLHNIYSILDFHQDLLAEAFCGEGIPRWAVKVPNNTYKFPFPLQWNAFETDSEGIPLGSECGKYPWAQFHFASATGHGYQSLYDNVDGIADSFAEFWGKVAERFKDSEAVLAYEIINEPWAGNWYKNPFLIIPSIADRWNLEPLYDKVQKKIRAQDESHIIMFESVTFDDFVPVGFSKVPGGDAYSNRSALSYHYYKEINFNLNLHFWTRMRDIQRLGGGGFITEFDFGVANTSIIEFLQASDSHLQSWAGWNYKSFPTNSGGGSYFYSPRGIVNWDLVKIVSRTYPQAVAGNTKGFSYNHDNKTFVLEYVSCKCGETEIYLNQDLHYPTGFTVQIEPNYAGTWRVIRKNIIGIKASSHMNGENIKVTITRK